MKMDLEHSDIAWMEEYGESPYERNIRREKEREGRYEYELSQSDWDERGLD